MKVIGRLPDERSCLSLVWAVLDRASRGWRGVVMTPAAVRLLQDLRRQLQHPSRLEEEVVDQPITPPRKIRDREPASAAFPPEAGRHPPAVHHRQQRGLRTDPDRGPGLLGPGTQLDGQVGQKHQVPRRPVGMAGQQARTSQLHKRSDAARFDRCLLPTATTSHPSRSEK